MEVSFQISSKALQKAEGISSEQNAQHLCSAKSAIVAGSLGPFGMKVLATHDMEEFTAVFFRIYKKNTDYYTVLMCSDQTRFFFLGYSYFILFGLLFQCCLI